MTDSPRMTKGERDDLIRLLKQREKVAKTAAEQRSSAMLAEFEQKMTNLDVFDNDQIWQAVVDVGIDAANKVNAAIMAEAEKLGIPKEFHPRLQFNWERRGKDEYKYRREELRRLAKAEIAAIEQVARVQIESKSVSAQTEVIATGLSSAAAIAFLESLPKIEEMMPALDPNTIQAKFITNNRQRGRYLGPHIVD